MMRHFLALTACIFAFSVASVTALRAQVGFDRPGGDYANAPVRGGDPAVCAARCDRDSRCRAWSFSYPRTASREAMCWLKSEVTPPKEDSCCVSGVRGAGVIEPRTGALEYRDRPLRRRLPQVRDRVRSDRQILRSGLRGRQSLPRLHLCAAGLWRRIGTLLSEG